MSKVKLITEQLIDDITDDIEKATAVYMLVSFSMKSGVSLLAPALKRAAERGAEIKICTGDYMYVTQPEALKMLHSIHPDITIRLWKGKGRSFHPKAYLMNFEQEEGVLYVGSSNLSGSALTNGIEWNVSVERSAAEESFDLALEKFMNIYLHEQTVPVNSETISTYEKDYEEAHQSLPDHFKEWLKEQEIPLMFNEQAVDHESVVQEERESYVNKKEISPRHAQLEALESLERTVEEDYSKAMVVMATGLGKTYLAGFFAQKYKRVLFVAHREEILYQAKKSFDHIMPDKTKGIVNGQFKDRDCEHVFASIFTLARDKELHKLDRQDFDLVIVDEFHHAAANSYQSLLEYFQPKFLLGLTATPDRMDGKDVFNLCDGNVAYQLHFIDAIQKKWLSPFHYYGVYEDTDYSQITWLGTRYDEEELLAAQLKESMAEHIFKSWKKHKQSRTLAFCSSVKQAEFLNRYFRSKGVRSVSLTAQSREMTRPEAIKRISNEELEVIFTVNLFNEGTDIPSIDTLLFVRPTESLTVFTQQVGRGLRLFDGKKHCVIIDLIGNYRNADIKLQLFNVEREKETKTSKAKVLPEIPANCYLELDTTVIDLFKELKRKQQPRKQKIVVAYEGLKEELGRRPTYLEFHRQANEDSKAIKQEFGSYPGFLNWADELTDLEKAAFSEGTDWLEEVERTSMSKSYKMVVLFFILERGQQEWLKPVKPDEVAPFFIDYFMAKEYRKRVDFNDKTTRSLTVNKAAKLIRSMPMTKWSGSSKGLLSFEDDVFSLNFQLSAESERHIYEWTLQICEFRLESYFEKKNQRLENNRH
ncbi:DEAD/DEAH box helicase family protein [Alteribacter populi]|uniref:DEAD/DEAH box helicase family protein n=1 Tax=Alteribacter populi TaxID=2011011 RepID=UPI000BBAE034|nr:DEAD/DEAH box helicase family protein [Alteribacter populi]